MHFFREKGTSLVGGYCVMTIQIRPLGEYPSDQGGESTKNLSLLVARSGPSILPQIRLSTKAIPKGEPGWFTTPSSTLFLLEKA